MRCVEGFEDGNLFIFVVLGIRLSLVCGVSFVNVYVIGCFFFGKVNLVYVVIRE